MKNIFSERAAGVLLHPTSLPDPYGIGTFGERACRFVDRLADAGIRRWQLLPLGPVGWGDSPYQSYSAFAGEPLMIDLFDLVEKGLLQEHLVLHEDFDPLAVEYDKVRAYKLPLLKEAYARFVSRKPFGDAFDRFCEEQKGWLEDYALFMAIKESTGGKPWQAWERGLRRREPDALDDAKKRLAERIDWHRFLQYLFFEQWRRLKRYAHTKGVAIVGDMPIYVSGDSADVWAHREYFELDEAGHPLRVAGVPPDYFSPTGQRWGNPLYDWGRLKARGYDWWMDRMAMALEMFDGIRIDHFRGFQAYWAIPAKEETAIDGEWVEGPGHHFFAALETRFGDLPIIAEDLGLITPEVEKLRDDFGFAGMKILQFAFGGGSDNPYLPHNYIHPHCVVYTGTHDNDTTLGWFETFDAKSRVLSYLSRSDDSIVWQMMREAMASTADTAIVPMQDILELGSDARMNTPGRAEGNWRWRMSEAQLDGAPWERLADLVRLYGRDR